MIATDQFVFSLQILGSGASYFAQGEAASFSTVDLLHMTYKASMKPTNTILFSILLYHFLHILDKYRLEKFLCCLLGQSTERQGVIPIYLVAYCCLLKPAWTNSSRSKNSKHL